MKSWKRDGAAHNGNANAPANQLPWLVGGFALLLLTQRFGIWVNGFPFPFALLLLFALPAYLLMRGMARIAPMRIVLLLIMLTSATVSFLINTQDGRFTSFFLFTVLYIPLCVTVPLTDTLYRSFQRKLAVVSIVFGLLGVLQYGLQFLVPKREPLFSWRGILPSQFLIEYNSGNTLGYLSNIFKSNGVFFLEASAVSQLLARAALIGRYCGSSWWIVVLAIVGIAVTYSGGGMIMFGLFFPFLIMREFSSHGAGRSLMFLGVGAIGAGTAGFFLIASGAFEIGAITGRINEFSTPGTSGWARYGSSGALIEFALSGKPIAQILFGIGPGTTEELFGSFRYEVFATSWVKLLVEYGIFGLTSFIVFLVYCIYASSRSVFITILLSFHYMLVEGNLLVPQYVMMLVLMGVLPTRMRG